MESLARNVGTWGHLFPMHKSLGRQWTPQHFSSKQMNGLVHETLVKDSILITGTIRLRHIGVDFQTYCAWTLDGEKNCLLVLTSPLSLLNFLFFISLPNLASSQWVQRHLEETMGASFLPSHYKGRNEAENITIGHFGKIHISAWTKVEKIVIAMSPRGARRHLPL